MNPIWLNAVRTSGALPWYLAGGAPAPVAAYQPKGAASLAASYVNLVNAGTFDAVPVVAPTWDTGTGWGLLETSTQWLDTGIVHSAGYSALVFFDSAVSMACLMGSFTGAGSRLAIYAASGTNRSYQNGGFLNLAGARINGVMAVAGQTAYYNGAAEAGAIPAFTGTATVSIGIGRMKGTSDYCTANIKALAIYSTTLTAHQVAAVSAAMAAL